MQALSVTEGSGCGGGLHAADTRSKMFVSLLASVLGVAVYDLTSKVFSLGVSWLFMRESPALLYVIVPIVVIGYVGSLCGLFSGVRAVRELRHAGIVRN